MSRTGPHLGKGTTDLHVYSIGVAVFHAMGAEMLLGSLNVGVRAAVQRCWLPLRLTLAGAGPAQARQDDFQLHRPVPKFQS